AVSSLLYTCQPYFNHLESTGRSTRRSFCLQLLSFSQQLCDRLEQLLLTYASHDLICLDEAEPNSISHFCVGQVQLGQMKVTTFRYCKPTPYLSRVDTGVYKRMRWNVQRLQEDHRRAEGTVQTASFSYFLCYEDIPNTHADPDSESEDASSDNVVRMWSIGQWVQVKPERTTDDIYDWILCEVPEASYRRLLFLGRNEPSCCTATDYLQQLLLTCHAD
uniref:Si:ch211-214c7.5 n=1 Tax=Poecilia reticulata TaxID=8081 RepID=A0A3P9PYT7_POERE